MNRYEDVATLRGMPYAEDLQCVPSSSCSSLLFVTGPRRSLSLELSDTRVYEPQIRARLGALPMKCMGRFRAKREQLETF